eukprot:TRINITY_DN2937_c0_g1_i13.p1 TRINITY_DN2937_c0_g1~~TRINITY_DN2937_c0_g1_i13.p1  ORF type:complete len:386 (-),score=96.50 TRINITY_DN2937_c0_g1_i13:175-1332(-)
MDATVERDIAKEYSVDSFPTLKFFRKGPKSEEYMGTRTANGLASWVSRISDGSSKHITTQDLLDSFVQLGNKVIAFIDPKEVPDWLRTAENEKAFAFSFGHVTDTSLFGSRPVGAIEVHKEGGVVVYDGSVPIMEFIEKESFPLISDLTQESWEHAMATQIPMLAVFSSKGDGERDVVLEVAKANKGSIITTISNNIEIGKHWGCSGRLVPTAAYVKPESHDGANIVIWNEDTEGPLNLESLNAFVKAAREGTYISYTKSEPIPTSNDGPVKIVVGKTFDSIVRSDKNVVIEFYAPWCTYCQRFEARYEELALTYQDDPEVVIAKIDGTANVAPDDLEITAFPTIMLFDVNNKVHRYEGDNSVDSLIEFVENYRVDVPKVSSEEL